MNHTIAAFINRVNAIMYGHRHRSDTPLACVLYAASLLYGALARLRSLLYQKHYCSSTALPCKVISIGNLAAGGTGKTPMTIFLAKQIQEMGMRPAVVSRGYKGFGERHGLVVSNGQRILYSAAHAGDEPYLLASLLEGVPVLIGADRLAAGQAAVAKFRPDVVLLDDAYQHQRLHRDLNVLLLDATAPFGNGHLLPRGPLRESSAAMSRADSVIFTRCTADHYVNRYKLEAKVPQLPVFLTSHRSVYRGCLAAGKDIGTLTLSRSAPNKDKGLDNERLLAFSGLANNSAFQDDLCNNRWVVSGMLGFGDHHRYTSGDMADIISAARIAKSTGLVTTDKDFVRLPLDWCLPLPLYVMGVEIDFHTDRQPLLQLLESLLC